MSTKTVREPIATWYLANVYSGEISSRRVVAFTEKTVTLLINTNWDKNNPRWEEVSANLANSYEALFPTFEEARLWLIGMLKRHVFRAKVSLHKAQVLLRNAKGLTEATDAD